MLDTRIPGIEETMRNYGQQRNPLAMLSVLCRSYRSDLILAFPGSKRSRGLLQGRFSWSIPSNRFN